MSFEEWYMENGFRGETAKIMLKQSWNGAIDQAVRVAEDLAEEFYNKDEKKWPQITQSRTVVAEIVADKLKELKETKS